MMLTQENPQNLLSEGESGKNLVGWELGENGLDQNWERQGGNWVGMGWKWERELAERERVGTG